MADTQDRKKLLQKVMEQDFVLQELVLFLDTHPYDCKALEMYHTAKTRSQQARAHYEAYFGPLCAADVTAVHQWSWLEDPWPWEN